MRGDWYLGLIAARRNRVTRRQGLSNRQTAQCSSDCGAGHASRRYHEVDEMHYGWFQLILSRDGG